MTDMINFVSWFFNNLPNFLFSAPLSYFVGLMLAAYVIKLILSLRG